MKVYVVNAFAETLFGGNPAAVISLDQWLADDMMQEIAAQHNLSETAFVVRKNDEFEIRWFTPTVEVDLCGHATLAAAHVFFNHLSYSAREIRFHSRSGILKASLANDGLIMLDFPVDHPERTAIPAEAIKALNADILECYRTSSDYLLVVKDQAEVEALRPDFSELKKIVARGVLVTAKGTESDFVSRCFFPQSGINEDPVTGSAHTALIPYWSKRLNKTSLSAIQLSARKGHLKCELVGDRVNIAGHAHTYLTGTILFE